MKYVINNKIENDIFFIENKSIFYQYFINYVLNEVTTQDIIDDALLCLEDPNHLDCDKEQIDYNYKFMNVIKETINLYNNKKYFKAYQFLVKSFEDDQYYYIDNCIEHITCEKYKAPKITKIDKKVIQDVNKFFKLKVFQ